MKAGFHDFWLTKLHFWGYITFTFTLNVPQGESELEDFKWVLQICDFSFEVILVALSTRTDPQGAEKCNIWNSTCQSAMVQISTGGGGTIKIAQKLKPPTKKTLCDAHISVWVLRFSPLWINMKEKYKKNYFKNEITDSRNQNSNIFEVPLFGIVRFRGRI